MDPAMIPRNIPNTIRSPNTLQKPAAPPKCASNGITKMQSADSMNEEATRGVNEN
jgi:hypothetical protein